MSKRFSLEDVPHGVACPNDSAWRMFLTVLHVQMCVSGALGNKRVYFFQRWKEGVKDLKIAHIMLIKKSKL